MVKLNEVFEELMRTLALKDFPTGEGKWRNENVWSSDSRLVAENAGSFSIESLTNLFHVEPFLKDISWSPTARQLRRECVMDPETHKHKDVFKSFLRLRLVDKNITEIDHNTLKFTNIEELVLSANKLSHIHTEFLPKSLKSLELCGNILDSLDDLSLPWLQHFGVSYNNLSALSPLQQKNWSALVSLDLSHNLLVCLRSTVNALRELTTLRTLAMRGNPISLLYIYRACTIDNLPSLMYMDELRVSTSERESCGGLSQLTDLPYKHFAVSLKISNMIGLSKNDTEDVSIPRIVTRYHFEFDFISECGVNNANTFSQLAEKEINSPIIECSVDTRDNDVSTLRTFQTNAFHVDEDMNTPISFDHVLISTNSDASRDLYCFVHEPIKLRLIETKLELHDEPKPSDDLKSQGDLAPSMAKPKKSATKRKSALAKNKGKAKTTDKPKYGGKGKSKEKGKPVKPVSTELFEWARHESVVSETEVDVLTILEEGCFDTQVTFAVTKQPVKERRASPTQCPPVVCTRCDVDFHMAILNCKSVRELQGSSHLFT